MIKTFEQAVKATEFVKDSFQPGLQALERKDLKRIHTKNSRTLRGSINLDKSLKKTHPNDPRWDYGIALRADDEKVDRVVWIEVHPAGSEHVGEVIRKHEWLRKWLSEAGSTLGGFQARYVWVASGKVTLKAGSPQLRKIAECGIGFAGERLEV